MIEIPLRNRKKEIVAYGLVDDEDVRLTDYTWFRDPDGYVKRNLPKVNGRNIGQIRLHREVLGLVPFDGLEGDHINGNRLDCRRHNLRIVTHLQNLQNVPARGGSSQYRGVTWDSVNGKWRAVVTSAGRRYDLGRFRYEAQAARVASDFRAKHLPHTNEERYATSG